MTLTLEERIAQAIVLAAHQSTREWAVRWLSGEDRTETAAWAAARAAATEAATAKAWAAAKAAEAEAAAGAVRAAAEAWAVRAAEAVVTRSPEPLRQPALLRARAILAGAFPADRYDEALA